MTLLAEIRDKAMRLHVPISVHLDITWRCNERCRHCYLDHDVPGELTSAEITEILQQLAGAGTLFLVVSGGEPLVRADCVEIMAHARRLSFHVKLKTNATLIGEREAAELARLGVGEVQVSVYSHRDEVHDSVTRMPGSLQRTLSAIRLLRSQGVRVIMVNTLMRTNATDYAGVRALAEQCGALYAFDPTITPRLNGDTSIVSLRLAPEALHQVLHDEAMIGRPPSCAQPAVDDGTLDAVPCSAGHSACYISPAGQVYPCVQFPLACGDLRRQSFREIWHDSPALKQVASIRVRDVSPCSACVHLVNCTRCPGLAYVEGNMRGPSSADCEKARVRFEV